MSGALEFIRFIKVILVLKMIKLRPRVEVSCCHINSNCLGWSVGVSLGNHIKITLPGELSHIQGKS